MGITKIFPETCMHVHEQVGAVVVQGDRPSSVNDARLPPAEQRRLLFNDLLFILWFAWQVVTDASTSETFNQPEDAAQDSKSMDMPGLTAHPFGCDCMTA